MKSLHISILLACATFLSAAFSSGAADLKIGIVDLKTNA